jgi:hypothetical protein
VGHAVDCSEETPEATREATDHVPSGFHRPPGRRSDTISLPGLVLTRPMEPAIA